MSKTRSLSLPVLFAMLVPVSYPASSSNVMFETDEVFVANVGAIERRHADGSKNSLEERNTSTLRIPTAPNASFGAIAFDSANNLLATTVPNGKEVHRFNQFGVWQGVFASGFEDARDIATRKLEQNYVYIADRKYSADQQAGTPRGALHKLDENGTLHASYSIPDIWSFDFANDCTIVYIKAPDSDDANIYAYDHCKQKQLKVLTKKPLDRFPYVVRFIGNDLFVGTDGQIQRFKLVGKHWNPVLVQTYAFGQFDRWSGIAATVKGDEFWASTYLASKRLYKFNIDSGQRVAGPLDLFDNTSMSGIFVNLGVFGGKSLTDLPPLELEEIAQ